MISPPELKDLPAPLIKTTFNVLFLILLSTFSNSQTNSGVIGLYFLGLFKVIVPISPSILNNISSDSSFISFSSEKSTFEMF